MVTRSITTIDPYNADPAKWYCHEIIYQWKLDSHFLNQGWYADRHNEIFSFPSIKIINNWVEKWLGHYLHIAVTSWWARWYLKSPASRLFTQPFIFRCRSKKTSKLRVTGLCEGNSPVTGKFLSQRASNARSISIWWRHHGPSSRLTWNVNTCIFYLISYFRNTIQDLLLYSPQPFIRVDTQKCRGISWDLDGHFVWRHFPQTKKQQ